MPIPAGADSDLFQLDDLRKLLRLTVADFDTGAATVARRQAGGWLSDATGLTAWPSPVPDTLWAWAIELAGIAYRNPTSDNAETTGAVSTQFGDRVRKAEILAAARRAYNTSAQPQYSFPEPDWRWE